MFTLTQWIYFIRKKTYKGPAMVTDDCKIRNMSAKRVELQIPLQKILEHKEGKHSGKAWENLRYK